MVNAETRQPHAMQSAIRLSSVAGGQRPATCTANAPQHPSKSPSLSAFQMNSRLLQRHSAPRLPLQSPPPPHASVALLLLPQLLCPPSCHCPIAASSLRVMSHAYLQVARLVTVQGTHPMPLVLSSSTRTHSVSPYSLSRTLARRRLGNGVTAFACGRRQPASEPASGSATGTAGATSNTVTVF